MEALPLPVEARKQHKGFWSNFPKPKSHNHSHHHSQHLSQSQNQTQINGQNQTLTQIQAHAYSNGANGEAGEASPPSFLLAASDPPRTPSPLLPDTVQTINTEVSPLPSPLMGPRLELEPLESPGTKTNAFFGSSWRSIIPVPAPPLPPPIHINGSSDHPDLSKASTTGSEPVNIPGSGHNRNHSNSHNKLHKPNHSAKEPERSQTADFFSNSNKYIPSPPPSIHHLSPDDKPEHAQRTGLARLLTGRVTDGARFPDEVHSAYSNYSGYPPSHSRSSSRSSVSGFTKPHEFVYWTDSSDLSRSSSISSVSGIRRDFGFTPIRDDITSSSPSNYSVSPLAQIRDEEEDTPVPATSPSELFTPTPTPTQCEPGRHGSHPLVRRETRRNAAKSELEAGMIIGDEAPLCLVRLLGKGAFSAVWLARDIEDRLIPPGPRQRRRKSVSTARRKDDPLPGLRPAPYAISHVPGGVLNELDGEGACLPRTPPSETDNSNPVDKLGKLVAVKMLDRVLCDVNDRTRIAFVREVEVLRHISHPSIVAFLHSFTTASHHCLVLEHVGGGELFELINTDENYAKLTTPLIRRMWGELCRAVGWLHGVSIVHRDIKLEIDLGTLPHPLVKLTDFGLARFIDPERPMLTTRCGSESYSAPEIVMGQMYDGRQTDAWACGIVLYALAIRTLPFDNKGEDDGRGSRRRYLVRIAKCEYTWPEDPVEGRLATDDLKQVIGRLLVRDPSKRARIVDLWDETFMRSEGAPSPPWRIAARRNKTNSGQGGDVSHNPNQTPTMENVPEEDEMEDEDEYEDAMLVDAHDISSIASQELL